MRLLERVRGRAYLYPPARYRQIARRRLVVAVLGIILYLPLIWLRFPGAGLVGGLWLVGWLENTRYLALAEGWERRDQQTRTTRSASQGTT